MPGRNNVGSNEYRFGFNGREKDDETNQSQGTEYDYGMRIYDTRICRFFSVDPLTKSYPWYTPFQFAGNKPITSIDRDGLEDVDYRVLQKNADGSLVVSVARTPNTNFNSHQGQIQIHKYDQDGKFDGKYTEFDYQELNAIFATTGGTSPNPTVQTYNPNPQTPTNSSDDYYDFAIPNKVMSNYSANIIGVGKSPDQVAGGTSLLSLSLQVSQHEKQTPALSLGGSIGLSAVNSPSQNQSSVINWVKGLVDPEQAKYGQDAKQVTELNVQVGGDIFAAMNITELKSSLQGAYPNAQISISKLDGDGQGSIDYKGTTLDRNPKKIDE